MDSGLLGRAATVAGPKSFSSINLIVFFNYFPQIFCPLTFAVRTVSPAAAPASLCFKFLPSTPICRNLKALGIFIYFSISSSHLFRFKFGAQTFPSPKRCCLAFPSFSCGSHPQASIDPLPQSPVIRFYQSSIDYQWRLDWGISWEDVGAVPLKGRVGRSLLWFSLQGFQKKDVWMCAPSPKLNGAQFGQIVLHLYTNSECILKKMQ